MKTKVIKIHAPEDRRYGHTTGVIWDAAYSIIAETENAKYLSINFANGIDVVVSKFYLPFAGGIRYFISVPTMSLAIPMQCSLLDTGLITTALKNGGYQLVPYIGNTYCTYGTLDVEKAITVAQILRDLGDF